MFRTLNIVTTIIFIFFTSVNSADECLGSSNNDACEAVFDPENMKQSCCQPMDQFVDIINECQSKSNTDVFSCEISKCVTNEYGIVTYGEIDEDKVRETLKKLTVEDPTTGPLNDEIMNNCLDGQFKKYITSDPSCETMLFQVCAFVSYLNGCSEFNTTPETCVQLGNNVATCKPVLNQYLNQSESC